MDINNQCSKAAALKICACIPSGVAVVSAFAEWSRYPHKKCIRTLAMACSFSVQCFSSIAATRPLLINFGCWARKWPYFRFHSKNNNGCLNF